MHRTVCFARTRRPSAPSVLSRFLQSSSRNRWCQKGLSNASSFINKQSGPTFRSLPSSGSPLFGRAFSASASRETEVEAKSLDSFETTPLGSLGKDLLDGLDVYSVPSEEDGHPLAVYGINSENPIQISDDPDVRPILLLHGRTWSSVPVYHLLGGPKRAADGVESRSLLEALLDSGLTPYCMDFRSFGGTHPDASGFVEPYRCVHDAESVLNWIAATHGIDKTPGAEKPALMGWSQGALVAQLAAQVAHPALCKLILYGSIYDPMVRYPREPLYTLNKPNRTIIENTFEMAVEDFTIEGTISSCVAKEFAEAALTSDPIKAVWRSLYQFNNIDPARVRCPTLLVGGDQDPYAPLHVQQELFSNLGRGFDRTWSILAESDHAAHLLEGRHRLINLVSSFVKNGKRAELEDRY